jgi:hypothetical protein
MDTLSYTGAVLKSFWLQSSGTILKPGGYLMGVPPHWGVISIFNRVYGLNLAFELFLSVIKYFEPVVAPYCSQPIDRVVLKLYSVTFCQEVALILN